MTMKALQVATGISHRKLRSHVGMRFVSRETDDLHRVLFEACLVPTDFDFKRILRH